MKALLFLLLSVATFTTATSSSYTEENNPIDIVNDKVRYQVEDNEQFIFLNLSTKDKTTAMSILRHGLSIFFDVNGKQKKDVCIKYPYDNKSVRLPRKPKPTEEDQNKDEEGPSIDYNAIIENMPGEAEFIFYGDNQQFHKDLNTYDITLGYHTIDDLFEFKLKIPKSRIIRDNNLDLSKLSIGVVTNKPERNSAKEDNKGSSSNQNARGRNGKQGHGGGIGRGGQGGRGGNRGGQQRPNVQPISIDFWFDAPLK